MLGNRSNAPQVRRSNAGVAPVAGLLLATYALVGRWSPSRLLDVEAELLVLSQPRIWIAVVLLGLAAVALATEPRRVRSESHLIHAPLLFAAYVLITLGWTPDPSEAWLKTLDLIVISAVTCAAYPIVMRSDPAELANWFWRVVVAIALVNAIALAASSTFTGPVKLTGLGGGPNILARILGLGCIGCLYLAHNSRLGLLWLAGAATSIVLVVLSGSRGGLLATVIALAYYSSRSRFLRPRTLLAVFIVIATLTGVLKFTSLGVSATEMFDERVAKLTLVERHDSGREPIYALAMDIGLAHPGFGAGIGAFQAIEPLGRYQHNLFLEVFSEGGLVGVGFLLMVFGIALKGATHATAPAKIAYTAAFVFIATASQFSGDLYDSRALLLLPLLSNAFVKKDSRNDVRLHRVVTNGSSATMYLRSTSKLIPRSQQ